MGLARSLNDLAQARGMSGHRYDHSAILRWISGQRPRDPAPALLTELLSLRLGVCVTPDDLGFPAESAADDVGRDFPQAWRDGVATVTALWRADVERRTFLLDSGFVLGASSTGALRWLIEPPPGGPGEPGAPVGAPSGTGARHVGTADVEAIREVTRSFGELDNRFGGGDLRAAVVRYLDGSVTPLLRDGAYDERVGRLLASTAAELTRLAGWMAYDLEQHGLAQRYLIQALRLSRSAGDHGLGGEILAGLSHQAIYIDEPGHALDLARAAQVSARRAGIPALRAEAYVLEAHAHAVMGEAAACAASLHRAETAFDRRTPGDEPEWIRYLDEAYLAAGFAQCFRDLGDGERAVRYARRSLDMDGRYIRGRMFNLTLLASAHIQNGDLDQACGTGVEALRLAGGLHSVRTRSYVLDLRRRLEPYEKEPAVADLTERSRRLTAA
jgi:hypothetical protein